MTDASTHVLARDNRSVDRSGLARRPIGPAEPIAAAAAEPATRPAAPATLAETGVSASVLHDLALRWLLRDPEASADRLARRMALPPVLIEALLAGLRHQRAVSVRRRGDFDGDVSYELTDTGRARAELAMHQCRYLGPAPVGLADYCRQVTRQTTATPVSRAALLDCLDGLVIAPDLIAPLGAALNADQPIYLYGPAGSGKSYLAEHLARLVSGSILVPYAIEVEGAIVQVFDPVVHRVVDEPAAAIARGDARWALCSRPVVRVGGEFSTDAMEATFDPLTRLYRAPVQLKANNGLLVVDDLGRQRESVTRLLNRWIVPLERRVDSLSLADGIGFDIPFAMKTIFSSNLTPRDLGDPAFLRRLGYKLPVTALSERDYLRVLVRACESLGVACDNEGALHLIRTLHPRDGVPTMAAYPRNLVSKIADRARFENLPPVLSVESIAWAWRVEFSPDVATPGSRPDSNQFNRSREQ